jgi:hypothetical protein
MTEIDTQAKLFKIETESDDFSDMVGVTGRLRLGPKVNYFANGGDSIELKRKRVFNKNGVVKVFTHLGNVFYFRLVDK